MKDELKKDLVYKKECIQTDQPVTPLIESERYLIENVNLIHFNSASFVDSNKTTKSHRQLQISYRLVKDIFRWVTDS